MTRIFESGASGSSSGASTWGSITGTISSQTDLQNVLNGLIPYTGATTNVNLGTHTIIAGNLSGSNTGDQTLVGLGGISKYARTATIVIAAYNSKDTTNADFICPSDNAEVTINAAIATLPAAGGVIQLLDGTFPIRGSIVVPSFCLLKGAGRGGATRIFKVIGGFPAITIDGPSNDVNTYTRSSSMEDITVEGNAQTGALLECHYAQTLFFNRCEFNGCNDGAIDLIQVQDTYFHQCTANTNHSTTLPVLHIRGGAGGNSNMIWFEQCRIEDFWYGAVKIEQGAGYAGNNNGFYFDQCKFESGVTAGDIFVADANTLDLHLNKIFIACTGWKTGYSTPVNAITSAAHGLVSFKDIFFNCVSGKGNSLLNVTVLNGTCVIDNLLFDGTPVTSVVIFNGASGGKFSIGEIGIGSGTIFSGDASGYNYIPIATTINGTLAASNLSGSNTGDQTTVSGNAGTATKLAATKNINGIAFDGSANITVPTLPLTLAGADSTGTGVIVGMTYGESITLGAPLYVSTDGKVYNADANAAGKFPVIGLALATAASGVNNVLLMGIYQFAAAHTDFTVGGVVYLSITVGTLTQTQPTATDDVIQVLGVALAIDTLLFNPTLQYITHT